METITKEVNFSDIMSLVDDEITWNKQVPIEPCDNPRCIYKAFKDYEGHGLLINISRDSNVGRSFIDGFKKFLSGNTYRVSLEFYDLNPKHEHLKKKFTAEPINLIMDEKMEVKAYVPTGNNSYHDSKQIHVVTEKSTIRVMFPHGNERLKEDDGKFNVSIFGVRFSIESFLNRYKGLNTIDGILYTLRYSSFKFDSKEDSSKFMFFLSEIKEFSVGKTEGISKTLQKIEPFYKELFKGKDFWKIAAFILATEASKSTVKNVKFSVAFNKMFGNVETKEQFDEIVSTMAEELFKEDVSYYSEDKRPYLERVLDAVPAAREVKKETLKRKSTGAINKIMDDLEFIRIDKDKYPLTHEAVFSGEIPKGTFFRKTGDTYFVYNNNWDIWEEMLRLHKKEAIEIATEASRRTTYEKDLMSYFYFVLNKLPEYLEKHTGRKWKCFPKLIDSENELDPPTEGSNGVSKRRSALTPIVDNEKNEVIVPYVSMRLSGYQTTYCYALDYNILSKGMSFMGNAITREVEENLNGRDNYGLMFYTLTGSAQGRGYPTFLIIFEKLDSGIRVHFHRTHPMRSKGGEYNPVHDWIVGCYKWMVGNVNFERIMAQQGDLVFVKTLEPLEEQDGNKFQEVNAYDNHKFETPVKFLPYIKKEKSNILGYFRIEKDIMLNHHEHKPRLISAGDYELRQCRSWEANPKGIWSLRID